MAVFTSTADRNVPLLTWACQVDLPMDDNYTFATKEMLVFINTFIDWTTYPGQSLKTIIAEPQKQELHKLVRVCELAREILGDIVDKQAVSIENIKEIDRMIQYLSAVPVNHHFKNTFTLEGKEFVPADTLYFDHKSDQPLVELVLAITQRILNIFPYQVKYVTRCEECRAPFVRYEYRPAQQYCSRRCAARAGERRRREDRKFLENVRQTTKQIREETGIFEFGTRG